jgi:hypothetical protein
MTTTLNATTSNGLVVTPDNSGNILLQYNGVSTPTFSASCNTAQSFTSGSAIKIQYNTEDWDTASCYDSTTNYRFTPTVAGYYQISATATFASASISSQLAIYKNGAAYMYGLYPNATSSAPTWTGVSGLVYMNGTTDYVEIYGTVFGTTVTYQATAAAKFQGCLLRGA